MNETYVDINTLDGATLRGVFCDVENAKSIVILAHGISSHKEEYLDMFKHLADNLKKNLIASIRFDFRAHGESDGNQEDFSVVSQIIDISSVISWIKNQAHLENTPLMYVGVSFGGAPILLHQFAHNSFERISLFAPVISFEKTFIKPSTPWGVKNFGSGKWDEALKTGFLYLDGEFKMGTKLLTELSFINPIDYLKKLNTPIQLFHGTEDDLVPCSVAESLVGKHSFLEISIIKGMGHGLYIKGDDEGLTNESVKLQNYYYEKVTEFFYER